MSETLSPGLQIAAYIAALTVALVVGYALGYAAATRHTPPSMPADAPPPAHRLSFQPLSAAHVYVLSPLGTWSRDDLQGGDTMQLGVRAGGAVSIVPYTPDRLYVDFHERHYQG